MDKILYFIAGISPTVEEAAEIALIEAATVAPYSLGIRSNTGNAEYGEDRLEPCDFVAGTPPQAYTDAEIGVFDPADVPESGIEGHEKVFSDGETVSIIDANDGSADANVAIEGSAAIITLAGTASIVNSGDARAIPVTGTYATTATFTVVAGVITAIVLS